MSINNQPYDNNIMLVYSQMYWCRPKCSTCKLTWHILIELNWIGLMSVITIWAVYGHGCQDSVHGSLYTIINLMSWRTDYWWQWSYMDCITNLSYPSLPSLSGQWAFSYAGPAAWNCLHQPLQTLVNTGTFKRHLKVHFYRVYLRHNIVMSCLLVT